MTTDPAESRTLLKSALDALKQGDRVTAHLLAQQAAALAPDTEAPWLVLAALVSPAESIGYAKKALAINPNSEKAQAALDWAMSRLPANPAEAEVEPPAAEIHVEPVEKTIEADQPEEVEPPAEEVRPVEGWPPSEQVYAAETMPPAEEVRPTANPEKFAEPPVVSTPPRAPARKGRWILIAIVVLVLIILAALIIYFNMPQLSGLLGLSAPAPKCIVPTLTLGTIRFSIQSLALGPKDLIIVPSAAGDDQAYWIEGTNTAFVFVLGQAAVPVIQNASLKAGDPMTIVWADCGQEDYVVSAIEPGQVNAGLLDQSSPGMRVFAESSDAGNGLLISGERPENPAAVTPEPARVGAVQAEVSFLDNVISADKKTLHLSVAIKNTGSTPISLSTSDISMSPEGLGAPLAPVSVNPALPQQIGPDESKTFAIIFPYAGDKMEVFKLLDFSVEQYY